MSRNSTDKETSYNICAISCTRLHKPQFAKRNKHYTLPAAAPLPAPPFPPSQASSVAVCFIPLPSISSAAMSLIRAGFQSRIKRNSSSSLDSTGKVNWMSALAVEKGKIHREI